MSILYTIAPLALGIATILRLRLWNSRPKTRALTVTLGSLAISITARMPFLGDDIINPAIHKLTGLANTSEIISHTFVIVGATGLAIIGSRMAGKTSAKPFIIAGTAIALVMILVYLASDASVVETPDLTSLGGRGVLIYWLLFSGGLGMGVIGIWYGAHEALKDVLSRHTRIALRFLIVGSIFALLYLGYKLIYLAWDLASIPALNESYLTISWILVGASLVAYAISGGFEGVFRLRQKWLNRTHKKR
ncbi:hypothetical protein [Lysinibacter sp. HNR]|uniref:hypothetical protein n=1 Tax=Lysinibacter sp. HNR TaxID=3031408 RepID=UPI0024360C74|nr:hypothetical protein [Lysinibacter sp. HNR]WGD38510.1 hypothetical protein FrondiHNR_06255 [Lysinibacter sp. HNR]